MVASPGSDTRTTVTGAAHQLMDTDVTGLRGGSTTADGHLHTSLDVMRLHGGSSGAAGSITKPTAAAALF